MSKKGSLRPSATFPLEVLAEIHRAADQGLYEIRGFGTKRSLPNFDDLLFLGASMSRYPLEGYREKCSTKVTLGTRFAKKPVELDIPITIAGMSFGALGAHAKEAIGRAASQMGTSTTTGDGGMTEEERQCSKTLVYQVLPSRYGLNPDDIRRADALEVVVGQGAKPGGGGMLLGQKITERVAEMRDLPEGIDQRSACRHPDWTGPDDLEIKIQELREITDWKIPIYIKIGATRVDYDVALSVKAGADVNAESVYGTVLMAAGRIEIAKLLIEGGADVNAGKTMSPHFGLVKNGIAYPGRLTRSRLRKRESPPTRFPGEFGKTGRVAVECCYPLPGSWYWLYGLVSLIASRSMWRVC